MVPFAVLRLPSQPKYIDGFPGLLADGYVGLAPAAAQSTCAVHKGPLGTGGLPQSTWDLGRVY